MRIVEVVRHGEEGYIPKYPEACPECIDSSTPCCVSCSASSMCCFLGRVEIMHEGREITKDVDQIFALCGNDMPPERMRL